MPTEQTRDPWHELHGIDDTVVGRRARPSGGADASTDCGDYVVVTDCAALYTTGNKKWRKSYYRHNTRPGSLKEVTMDVLMEKFGGSEVLRKAVSGMLPKNRLRKKRLARLKAFEGEAHPYDQNLARFGGKVVGSEGWAQVAEKIREAGAARL